MLKLPLRLLLILLTFPLSGCISDIWTGASIIYNRHDLYKKIDNYRLGMQVNQALYKDHILKCKECHLEIAVFHDDILLLGNLPNENFKQEATKRVKSIAGHYRLFNQISIGPITNSSIEDSLITTKIRSQIIANSNIDPSAFKVVTYEGNVYLMGNVLPEQADLVVKMARTSLGVKRVVKLFRYYHLSN